MLSGLALVRQASFFACLFFDLSPSLDDGPVAAAVNVGRCQVAKTFVIAVVLVALDEGADAGLEVARWFCRAIAESCVRRWKEGGVSW